MGKSWDFSEILMEQPRGAQMIYFGPYQLDCDQGLRRGLTEVRITPKPLTLLCVLAKRAGEVVSKEELFRTVWADTAVSDSALTTCVRELRKVLRDSAKRPRFIETLHRRGYRFLVRTSSSTAAECREVSPPSAGSASLLVRPEAAFEEMLAANQDSQMLFATGKPRIGKTTAVQAFLARIAAPSDPMMSGTSALACGDWTNARTQFEAALGLKETAPALEGLSEALFWLEEIGPSLEYRARAYALYCEQGDFCRAVRAALWSVWSYVGSYGNLAVGNGWLRRAERLLGDVGDCAEQGWYELFRSKIALDAASSAQHARRAWEVARRYSDRDLELWALSQEGRALVTIGRVDEGMTLLDEAVAAATAGEARNLRVVGDTCCNMLSACDRASDFDRATQWCEVVDEFTRRHRGVPIFHYCRVVYSGVLMATGRWQEAEQELRTGLQAVEKQHPAQKVYSLNRLALLCVRQGRLEEAAQLLVGLETQAGAAEAMASLHLHCGRATLANALLEKRLLSHTDDLVAAPLLPLLVDTKLLLGDLAAARTSAVSLLEIGERTARSLVQAQASFALGRVDFACGEPSLKHLENACTAFENLSMPFDGALARLEWARALASDNRDVGLEYARLALSVFERLGARLHSDHAAALLRDLGAGSRPGPRVSGELTRREHEVLRLVSHGLSNLEISKRLFISPKTVEHHVSRILSKLALRNRAEAIGWALRNSFPKSGTK